jgi:beta propeller repeat protein
LSGGAKGEEANENEGRPVILSGTSNRISNHFVRGNCEYFLKGEKMNRNHILITSAFLLLQVSTITFADFPVFKIASGGIWPQISGNNVVWGNTDNTIGLYNLATKTKTLINAFDNDGRPGIDNDIVVWTRNNTVYGYRISTGQQFTVATSSGYVGGARVSGNTVVWADTRSGGNGDVYGYDLAAEKEFLVSNNTNGNGIPVISGNYIAWSDQRNISAPTYVDIYGYDLQTKTEFPICTAEGWQGDTSIGNNIVAWTDTRGGVQSIYGYNLLTKTEFNVATEPGADGSAASGNYLVWSDERNGNGDIYGYDLLTNKEFAICTTYGRESWPSISGNTVVWVGHDGGIYGAVVPEPCTLLLLGLGAAIVRKRKI